MVLDQQLIRGSVLLFESEVQSLNCLYQVKKQPIKVLIDSGTTGNFITDDLMTAWDLPVELEMQHQDLKLADGSMVLGSRTSVVQIAMWGLQDQNYSPGISESAQGGDLRNALANSRKSCN